MYVHLVLLLLSNTTIQLCHTVATAIILGSLYKYPTTMENIVFVTSEAREYLRERVMYKI